MVCSCHTSPHYVCSICCTLPDESEWSVSFSTDEIPFRFCIDFEEDDFVRAGADHPKVSNYGVIVVDTTDAGCPQGDRCGYFDEGRLEIPSFSNAYTGISSFRITFNYLRMAGGEDHQGIFSNDCFNGEADLPGNSLAAACAYGSVASLLNEPEALVVTVSAKGMYQVKQIPK